MPQWQGRKERAYVPRPRRTAILDGAHGHPLATMASNSYARTCSPWSQRATLVNGKLVELPEEKEEAKPKKHKRS